ncbi:MAG TPA: hypothetical protein VF453_07295 [Burkholderiaceae bacterium]
MNDSTKRTIMARSAVGDIPILPVLPEAIAVLDDGLRFGHAERVTAGAAELAPA